MAYNSNASRIEQKHSHLWFTDGIEANVFPNKKQAVEIPSQSSFSGLLNTSIAPPWGPTSSFHSVANQLNDKLFNPETAGMINYDETNIISAEPGNMHTARKLTEDPFGSESSFGLSMSHNLEDPKFSLNYGGIRKVKVSQVKDTMPETLSHIYSRGVTDTILTDHGFSKEDDNTVSMGLPFHNMISVSDTFNREDNSFLSMVQTCNKEETDDSFLSRTYKETSGVSLMSQSIDSDESNITTRSCTFIEGVASTAILGHSIKENDAIVSLCQSFSNDDSSATSMGQNTSKLKTVDSPVCHSYKKVKNSIPPRAQTSNQINSSLLLKNSLKKGGSSIISFGGFNHDDEMNAPGRIMSSYELLIGQSSVGGSDALKQKVFVESSADTLTSANEVFTSSDGVLKKEQKAAKKPSPNNFPSNVRSLLSTGILDGVPVKYIAWSREKELRGIIKGSAYLCGCISCNFLKAVNAYEFERHADSKTKHPNNHIYFENGKTIYGIVQELRNTPQNLLFEVIQTITGSPINQKSFRLWKESFLAAARELQRIYGEDEAKQLS